MVSEALQPGGRKPAPYPLSLVQDLLNTADLESGDDPADPATVADWAHRAGIPDDAHARRELVLIRELLRAWIRSGEVAVPAALGSRLEELQLTVAPVDGRLALTGRTPLARALGPVFDAVRQAIDTGQWLRLKSCDRDRCRWVFYDHSKNASSHWCSTTVCGAREKSRRAYARHARRG